MQIKKPNSLKLTFKYILGWILLAEACSGVARYMTTEPVIADHVNENVVYISALSFFVIVSLFNIISDIRSGIVYYRTFRGRAKRIDEALTQAGIATGSGVSTEFSPLFKNLHGWWDNKEKNNTSIETLKEYDGDGWTYKDTYSYTTGSRYDYGILSIPLSRTLPNLVFDSRQEHNGQLAIAFDEDQQIHLEGNFDTYFNTYFPAHYEIDALSIITPTVMEGVLALKGHNVEIYNDTLFVFGSVFVPEQLPTIIQSGLQLRDLLAKQTPNYRDQRAQNSANRSEIHVYGKSIQRDFIRKAVRYSVIALILFVIATSYTLHLLHITSTNIMDVLVNTSPEHKYDNRIPLALTSLLGGIWCLWSAIDTVQTGAAERRKRFNANYLLGTNE